MKGQVLDDGYQTNIVILCIAFFFFDNVLCIALGYGAAIFAKNE